MLSAIFGLVQFFGGKVADHVERKSRLKAARLEADIAIEQKRATADIDWDSQQAAASATSWKDEFWTLVLAFPLFVVFFATLFDRPQLIDRLREGFKVLADLPEWYLVGLGVAIAAAFGYRKIVGLMATRKPGG